MQRQTLKRDQLFGDNLPPDTQALLAEGRELARDIGTGRCAFLDRYKTKSEYDFKLSMAEQRRIMFHGQIGYRTLEKTRQAYRCIYESLGDEGYQIHRYGICLDWSMGYPVKERKGMPKGTGLILENPDQFCTLTESAPVAPHFGDFVLGTPAALENTIAALQAGSTSIGNLGQYFNFDMPRWNDESRTTAETVKAISLCVAQLEPVLIHSNLDDGFLSLYTDICCGFGQVLLERYIIEELFGGYVSHCYGHTYSEPVSRMAFQRALAQTSRTPGTVVYGNTTIYKENQIANYAGLGAYMLTDILAQQLQPSGHALNPVPVTEALRIPEINEIIDAHIFANRLNERAEGFPALIDLQKVDEITQALIQGGERFKHNVINGLETAGIDITDPCELLLSIRKIGAKELERLFGPGRMDNARPRRRNPVIMATTIRELDTQADLAIETLSEKQQNIIRQANLSACIACTDVHEYAKILIENILEKTGVTTIDAGVSIDPDEVARCAKTHTVDLIAISTYNGIAFPYLQELKRCMEAHGQSCPVFVGGKICHIPEGSENSLPVNVIREVKSLGMITCDRVEELLEALPGLASARV